MKGPFSVPAGARPACAVLLMSVGAACPTALAGQEAETINHGTPIIIPPGGTGPGNPPFNGPSAQPIPFDNDDPGTTLRFDYGEAPDFAPLCDRPGLGFFPTRQNSPSASGGRGGPRHLEIDPSINVYFGLGVSHELTNTSPQCDWLSPACDARDDGVMLLCLDPECAAGIMISRGTCGFGLGASFGAAPPVETPNAFLLMRTQTGDSYLGTHYVNVAADYDNDGTMLNLAASWALRDVPVDPRPGFSQIHRTETFPLQSFEANSSDDWSVGSFWVRAMVSEEAVVLSNSFWDGSGTATPYQWGETEDWIVRTQLGRWLCRLPEASVQTTLHAVVSLDPFDTEVLNGIEFTISSAGQPSGKVRQFREATVEPNQPVPVEVTSLTLRGNIPELGGTVNFRERTDRLSLGVLDVFQTSAGSVADADVFLDLSFAIDLLDIPRTLDTRDAFVRVEAPAIGSFPPQGVPLLARADSAPLPLVDRATLALAGWMRVVSVEFTQVTSGGCPGDANNDGEVNFADVTAVLSAWGQPGAGGDASGDCFVDFIDVTAVLANWNTACP